MPGFTPMSMFPLMWAATGLDYPALVDRLVQTALRRATRPAALSAPSLPGNGLLRPAAARSTSGAVASARWHGAPAPCTSTYGRRGRTVVKTYAVGGSAENQPTPSTSTQLGRRPSARRGAATPQRSTTAGSPQAAVRRRRGLGVARRSRPSSAAGRASCSRRAAGGRAPSGTRDGDRPAAGEQAPQQHGGAAAAGEPASGRRRGRLRGGRPGRSACG